MEEINDNAANKRHTILYFIEYEWIPKLVNDVNLGVVNWGILRSLASWQNYFKKSMPWIEVDWDELREETFRVDDDHVLIVYVFPDPEQVPEAAFGAVFVNEKTGASRYFTLEIGHSGAWFLGEMINNKHNNHGVATVPTLDYFLKWVININSAKK